MRSKIIHGDARNSLSLIGNGVANTVITSPPYWGLRSYDEEGQIGLEDDPEDYIKELVSIFRGVREVLRDDGTLWLNLGDSYIGVNNTNIGGNGNFGGNPGRDIQVERCKNAYGLSKKNLVGIPWRVAFALQGDGWILRSDIVWSKPSTFPESIVDRPTRAHEFIFLFAKQKNYYYDYEATLEKAKGGGTRRRRDVWHVAPAQFKDAHFATFPPKLIEPCILAGAPKGGVVFDPFSGAGSTGVPSIALGRKFLGIEMNESYCKMSRDRLGLL